MQDATHPKDSLIRNERRGVWLALGVILILVSTLLTGGEVRQGALRALPIGLVVAIAWLVQQRTRGAKLALRENRDAVVHDEWRQMAIGRAAQWALALILGALTLFCLLGMVAKLDLSGQMVAVLAIALGATAFLVMFLLFDRD